MPEVVGNMTDGPAPYEFGRDQNGREGKRRREMEGTGRIEMLWEIFIYHQREAARGGLRRIVRKD